MISEDFYGKKQFVWWTGIVENRLDPLKLGSVQVRIIGLHPIEDDEKNFVPTEKLPWAQVLLPTTGAKTTSGPREGDWVFGFFQDGEYAQIPVVVGVFPGIESQQSQFVYQEAIVRKIKNEQSVNVSSNVTVLDVLSTNNTDIVANTVPTMPEGQTVRTPGQPTTPPLARGITVGTGIEMVNNLLEHSCDLSFLVKKDVAESKSKVLTAITEARSKLEAIFQGQSNSPLSQLITQIKDTIQKYLYMIKLGISIVKGVIKAGLELLQYIKDLIAWALSLPGKLLELIKRCVSSVLVPIGQAVDEVFTKSDLAIGVSFGAAFLAQLNGLSSKASAASLTSVSGSLNYSSSSSLADTIKIANNITLSANTIDKIEEISESISLNEDQVSEAAGQPYDRNSYGTV